MNRTVELTVGIALVILGLFISTFVGAQGMCNNPSLYCVNDPTISDYIGLWIFFGGVIAASGGAIVGHSLKRKATAIGGR
jgi:hypothetical protein